MSGKNNEFIYLAFLTEPRNVGESTKRSPQHLTLVPPFPNDISVSEIKKVVSDVATQTAAFNIHVSGEARLGPNHNINVRLVEPVDTVRVLHSNLMYKLESLGATLPAKYVHKDFLPHITIKPAHSTNLHTDQVITVDHIAIMHKDRGHRTLLARQELRGEDELG